jgi:sugar O-acyltransferase (sialic acid O-acetyltransferase NeuD family)
MNEKRIIVLGAGGNSIGILDAIEAANAAGTDSFRIEGILDDIADNLGRSFLGCKVLGRIDEASRFEGCLFVNGISSVDSFRKMPAIVARTGLDSSRFATVIHPRATVAASARIGAGTSILAGSVICPEAVIGEHVIVLQNTSVNHHSRVGDFATLSATVTVLGFIEIGRGAFVSGGSTIAPRVKIGDSALVGAGSVVLRDVPAGRVFAGNPARELEKSRYRLDAGSGA